MVRHIVLFKLKEHAEGASKDENARLVKAKLEGLRTKVPGLLDLDVGINFRSGDSAYDVALSSLFESRAALEAYTVHPEHTAVAAFTRRVRESSVVTDYDVESGSRNTADPHTAGSEPAQVATAATEPADSAPWSETRLLGLASAFQETRILLSAAELDLFGLLANAPMTAPELATKLGADGQALQTLLDALSAMGLLEKRKDAYRTDPSATNLLVNGRPGSILPMILHRVNLWTRWSSLTQVVAGPQTEKRADQAWLRWFIGAMHVVAAPQAAGIVALVDAGSSRRLLDVGGASGTYTLAFLKAVPEMRATLFDRPDVIQMARERLGEAGVLDRVALVGGDFYTDPLPDGQDLVFVSAIIHQNSARQNVELFRKAFAALDPGGRIVVRDHVLSADRTQPKAGALFAVNMLVARNGGNSYTFDEIRAALEEAGFVRVELIHPDTRMDGLVEAFKP